MTERHGSATVTLPSDTEILITRSFEAPRWLVWDAMTTPRHLLRWWGPHYHPLVACEIDLRPGGSWRYVSRGTDGVELAWHGVYHDVVAPERIESTEVFEGFPDAESRNTMTLTEAFLAGADHIVVGRPIRQASDPRAAAEAVQAEIARLFAD